MMPSATITHNNLHSLLKWKAIGCITGSNAPDNKVSLFKALRDAAVMVQSLTRVDEVLPAKISNMQKTPPNLYFSLWKQLAQFPRQPRNHAKNHVTQPSVILFLIISAIQIPNQKLFSTAGHRGLKEGRAYFIHAVSGSSFSFSRTSSIHTFKPSIMKRMKKKDKHSVSG